MAIEQKRKLINDTTYLVTQMDAIKALKVQTKLVSILGPGLFNLVDKEGIKQDNILKALAPIVDNFDDERATALILSLFDTGIFVEHTVEGKKIPQSIDFAIHFTGKAGEMWQVVAFILEVNFLPGELIKLSSFITSPQDKKKQES